MEICDSLPPRRTGRADFPHPALTIVAAVGMRRQLSGCASQIQVTTNRWATIVGDDVTIGHNVVLHGCTIGSRCLIGIGAIVLDGCEIGDDCIIAAGSVVTPGTKAESGSSSSAARRVSCAGSRSRSSSFCSRRRGTTSPMRRGTRVRGFCEAVCLSAREPVRRFAGVRVRRRARGRGDAVIRSGRERQRFVSRADVIAAVAVHERDAERVAFARRELDVVGVAGR